MAFEGNTLVNGEWITRTFDVNTALKHADQQDEEDAARRMDIQQAPKYGLLTQTVVRSPLVHWILPVRLRDSRIHDVAFIGDDFVQIKELRSDGLLWDIVQKEDFGARIRNAAVIGSVAAYEEDPDTHFDSTQVKSEDEVSSPGQEGSSHQSEAATSTRRRLPPQFLVLQLETGDSIFLMLQTNDLGQPRFVASQYRVSKQMLRFEPGIQITVDPTSRFMVVGCALHTFAIYELESRVNLKKQFAKDEKLIHVKTCTIIPVEDTIMKLDFLHSPRGPEHQDVIILLTLLIRKGKTRMKVWEWGAQDVRNTAKPKGKKWKGYEIDKSHRVPLLVVPLMHNSSFIMVYEKYMSVCEGVMEGAPTFADFGVEDDPLQVPTPYHNGKGYPLWTAWTRPARRKDFFEQADNIYIAREDGVVMFVHIEHDVPPQNNIVGKLNANCGTAFASLDFAGFRRKDGDLLVTGGDSCSGGTYLVQARGGPILTEPVQNWTPAQDIVSTYAVDSVDTHVYGGQIRAREVIPNPDRIFVCGGKGLRATITEIRHGLEARIGLETDYETPILQAWALPSEFEAVEDYDASLFLLSLGDSSSVLTLSGDATDIAELDESSTKFSLRSRAIAVAAHANSIVQVTEKGIRVIGVDFLRNYGVAELPGMVGNDIVNAAVKDGVVIFTTYVDNASTAYLQVLDHALLSTNMDLDENTSVRTLSILSTAITSLLVAEIAQRQFAIAAEWSELSMSVELHTISGNSQYKIDLLEAFEDFSTRLEAVASLEIVSCLNHTFLLLCGTHNGFLMTLAISSISFEIIDKRIDRIGATSAMLTRDEHPDRMNNFFVRCDCKLYHLRPQLSGYMGGSAGQWLNQAHSIHQIWLSDASNPGLSQPAITAFTQLRQTTSPMSKLRESLLIVSGSNMFLADLSILPKVVPRHISIKGTPTRLLYSHSLRALVVAVSIKGAPTNDENPIPQRPTLQFIDPETGQDLSEAVARDTKLPVDLVAGLDKSEDSGKIFRLFEWAFTKEGKTWNYLIVATSLGRLLIISAEDTSIRENGHISGQSRPKIQYWTRYMFKVSEPVYSVTGFPEGLLWCAGTKLYCDVLDQTQRKFKRVAEYDLPSSAINLEYSNRTIYALTQAHSLEILTLNLDEGGESSIVRTHGDQITRDALHHTTLPFPSQRPLHLVSDKSCSLVGLWPITNTKADTLETIFEAELRHSIVRFRSAKCRPVWDDSWHDQNSNTNDTNRYEYTPGHSSRPETLGLSIMGSLSHFTVLELPAWNYLRFIVDLAVRSPTVCQFTCKDTPIPEDGVTEPKLRMHIDGDILKRCLVDRHLEELLLIGNDTPEAMIISARFCKLLREYHEGKFAENTQLEVYVEQAYADLNFFLRPVM